MKWLWSWSRTCVLVGFTPSTILISMVRKPLAGRITNYWVPYTKFWRVSVSLCWLWAINLAVSSDYPLQFSSFRWVENEQVPKRAREIFKTKRSLIFGSSYWKVNSPGEAFLLLIQVMWASLFSIQRFSNSC